MKFARSITGIALVMGAAARVVHAQEADAPRASAPDAGPAAVYGPPALVPEARSKAQAEEAAARATAELERKQAAALSAAREDLERELAAERASRATLDERLRALDATVAKQAERTTVETARTGLTLRGFLQSDWAFRQSSQDQLNPSTGAPLNEDRISIRRARLRASLERTYVAGAVEFDGSTTRGATARIIGAEASLRLPPPDATSPPLAMLTLGLFKIPFGFEVREADTDRLFLERSTTERGLFPGEYDAGARLQGGWRFVRYAVAVMNGEPLGEGSFPGRDPNHQKDVVGRLGVDTGQIGPVTLIAGVSGLGGKGFHPGTAATKPVIIWQDRNEDGQFQANEVQVAPA